ncbi:hypothetical protein JCM3774_006280 [Rhodotorula dairenensis]
MLRSPATASMLRFSTVARRGRTFASTASARTTHPAHSSSGEQSVGQDMGEVKTKNSMVPLFMAIGAASVGYIAYAQMVRRVLRRLAGSTSAGPAVGSKMDPYLRSRN